MPDDPNADTDVYEAALDPADDTPDLTDAQATLQQDEQAEAAAAATGDYATANNDAQQAYGASQDVANAGGPDSTDATWEAAQNESWANSDQQTADQDALTAASYANDPSGNPDDAADAALYGGDAQTEEATADDSAAAGEYGDPVGPADDTATAVDDTPVDDTPAVDDTATADDDSSAGD
jgi:hypothetical protein